MKIFLWRMARLKRMKMKTKNETLVLRSSELSVRTIQYLTWVLWWVQWTEMKMKALLMRLR